MSIIESALSDELSRARGRSRAEPLPQTIVLLAGGAGLQEFTQAIHRSILDLPIVGPGAPRSLGQHWWSQIEELVGAPWSGPIDLRIVGGTQADLPLNSDRISIIQSSDPKELRGTGGVLRDLVESHSDDDFILVGSAATLLLEPLTPLVLDLFAADSDVAFFVDDDDVASSLMLIRCGCLRDIPEMGFVDFKEQALPRIAAANSVTVLRRPQPVAGSLRTPAEYLRTLRAFNRKSRGDGRTGDAVHDGLFAGGAFSEEWEPVFQIIEEGSHVGSDVRVHDSVVLRGARVGDGAVLVRSVVCPGVVVPAGAVLVDRLVEATNGKSRSRGPRTHE